MKPEALLFDVDDTLTDVTNSYRMATVATAKWFGVNISFDDITEAKAAGDANNDWVLTQKLLADRGVHIPLEDVTEKFEEYYQGTEQTLGMRKTEKLLIDAEELAALAKSYKLGIVTGRPRKDANNFLTENNLGHLFKAVITMDDGPLKPNPTPIRMAMEQLGVTSAWMFGDTPDDVRSAVQAGIVAIGVVAPADEPMVARKAMLDAGAKAVINVISDIYEVLP